MKSENEKQKFALAIFQNLGINRSYRSLANLTGISKTHLNRWGADFDWNEKVGEFDAKNISAAEQQKNLDKLIPRFQRSLEAVEPYEGVINELLEQCGVVLETGFDRDEETGRLIPKFEIKNVKEYVALLGAIGDLIDLVRKEKNRKPPGGTGDKGTTNIENLLVMLGDADESTQRKFIEASHGTAVGKRTPEVAGTSPEADFEEVPDTDDTED